MLHEIIWLSFCGFLNFNQLPAAKKKDMDKMSIPTKVWLFLFRIEYRLNPKLFDFGHFQNLLISTPYNFITKNKFPDDEEGEGEGEEDSDEEGEGEEDSDEEGEVFSRIF